MNDIRDISVKYETHLQFHLQYKISIIFVIFQYFCIYLSLYMYTWETK